MQSIKLPAHLLGKDLRQPGSLGDHAASVEVTKNQHGLSYWFNNHKFHPQFATSKHIAVFHIKLK